MEGTITQPILKLRHSQDITVRCLPPQRARERTPGGVYSLEVVSFGDYVHVTGSLPLRSRHQNPIQYRVLVSESRGDGPISSDRANCIVGPATSAPSLFAPTLVGHIQRRAPFRSLDVIVSGEDADESGWIDLEALVRDRVGRDRYMSRNLVPGEFERLRWKPDGALATIDISARPDDVEWLVVRLEVRELLHRQTGTTRPLPGSGRTALVRVDNAARAAGSNTQHPRDRAREIFAAAL